MKLLRSKLPLLGPGWYFLQREDEYMTRQPVNTDPPTCYGAEPGPHDNRTYPDYDSKKVRTLSYPTNISYEKALSLAEAVGRVIDYQKCRDGTIYSFKVVPNG